MAIHLGFLLLFFVLSAGYFAVSRAQANRCEQGWNYYGGNCYMFETRKANKTIWESAQSVCQSKQANLVTVNDANEQKFLRGLWGKFGSWIGLNNRDDLRVFKWVSGEQSSFTDWAPGEPQISVDKRCARGNIYITGRLWSMSNCEKKLYRYTCEKASISPCDSGPCKNGGTCSATINDYQCQCPDRFTGKQCETSLDPCSPNPCQNGGFCYSITDKLYYCSCGGGFTGDNCEIRPKCKTVNPCINGGTCVDLTDTKICKCPSEYTGNNCQGKFPLITLNPKDAVRMAGEDVKFCCDAEGEPAPTFSWLYNEVVMENEKSKTLSLTGLTTDDAGLYKCRATNEYGKVVSSEAKLVVIAGGGDDSCDPTPLSNLVSLPAGCTEVSSGSSTVNVGICSYDECIKRGQGDSGSCRGEEDNTKRCCSPTSMVDSEVRCGNSIRFNLQKVSRCACSVCAVPDIVIHGMIVDEDGSPLKQGVLTVAGETKKYYTDLKGNFKLTLKSGTKRAVLNIKDPFGNLEETTKALDLHAGQVSFYTIVLQKKPPAIKFTATQNKNIPLGSPTKPKLCDVDVPANAFVGADGDIFKGEITANVAVIDPRSTEDMAAAPGDFSAVDDNGEELMLGTAGILRQSFTDSNGNKLNLDKNITIRIDADQLNIPAGVDVNQYYLDSLTGRWVMFSVLRIENEQVQGDDGKTKRQARKKFFVGEITPNVPYDTINWDYVRTTSYVRVVGPSGAVVTRIHRSGQSFTSYRQESIPSSGILCIRSLRNTPAVMQAELNGAPLIPQQPSNFPAGVITENPPIIAGDDPRNPFKIQSIQFTSVATDGTGPIYTKDQSSRCQQRSSGDLAFEFQEASAGEAFQWNSPRETNPNSNLVWSVRRNQLCFIKAVVSGSKPESVIYVKSTGKAPGQSALDYGYSAEKPALVGNEGVVCLEYRCNDPQSTYQTHLQVLTLTGSCTVPSTNAVLSTGQSRCRVTPDPDSSQEQNFCVPTDLQGGDAGLYSGDAGVARSRCLTGNNNYSGSQGRPVTTNSKTTLTLSCS